MEKILKTLNIEIKDIDDEERSFLAVASTEDIDRDGDRIMSAGWNMDNYLKNPVIPWAHNYSEPPVARAEDIWVEDGRLMFRPKFPEPDAYPYAETIWKLYKGGFLKAFSVGFRPIRREIVDRGKGIRGYDYMEQELWEISACTIPSNPNALVAAKAQGIISDEEMKKFEVGGAERRAESAGREAQSDTDPASPGGSAGTSNGQRTTDNGHENNEPLLLSPPLDEPQAIEKRLDNIGEKLDALIILMGKVHVERIHDPQHETASIEADETQSTEPDAIPHSEFPILHSETLSPDAITKAVTEALQGIDRRIADAVDSRLKYHLGIME